MKKKSSERQTGAGVRFDSFGAFEITDAHLLAMVSAGKGESDSVSQLMGASDAQLLSTDGACPDNVVCLINIPCITTNSECTFNTRCKDTFC